MKLKNALLLPLTIVSDICTFGIFEVTKTHIQSDVIEQAVDHYVEINRAQNKPKDKA